uniref:Multiple inositol polyphosphate phosphatase 1 n=1 Tax=Dermatophagoides pteronyssinus TaxID=6956 RepID=A0A6P6YJ48_DERPT|nr:multiple inositol polyphosphate phosphatase 1-like [Dermatophagoides pteronyssinus]
MTIIMWNFSRIFLIIIISIFIDERFVQTTTNESNETTCFDFSNVLSSSTNDTLECNKYRLFSTKTTYLTAREEIRKIFPTKWPNEELRKCQPIYLFFLNRHSIRYPSAREIGKFNQLLHSIRRELLESDKLNYRMYIYLITWRFRMLPNDDNHVSYTGKLQTARTAEIFYKLFPTLLDIGKIPQFDVGISTKIRTEETADAFIDSLINIQLNHQNSQSKNEIKQKKFPKISKDVLMSHKKCKRLIEDSLSESSESSSSKIPKSKKFSKLLESKPIKMMSINFSQRNGLKYTMKIESLIMLYKACSYETAIYTFSPWCHLFSESELKIIEYLLDIDEYFDAYQIEPYRKMACSVIGDLQSKLVSIIQQPEAQLTNTTLYFSHENLLSKVFSYFGLFNKFPDVNLDLPSSDDDNDNTRFCIADDREWRSSLIVPFGTNFVAVLYKCNSQQQDQHQQQPAFKVLTLVNEIPVIVRGCNSSLCNIDLFFNEFYNDQNDCDLPKICKLSS